MNALLLGYYGAKNLGDDLMLYCLLQWLKKQSIEVTVISENPKDTKERFHIDAIQNAPLFGEWGWYSSWFKGKALALIRSLWNADALIVGGGDLIRDDCGWRVFFYTMEKLIVAMILGKKIFLVNTGIGEPKTWYGSILIKMVLKKCGNIIVRDERSVKVCRRFGIENCRLLPDIVTYFSDFYPVSGDKQTPEGLPSNPYLLVCLRANAEEYGRFKDPARLTKNLARLLDEYVAQTSHAIVFLPFQSTNENDDNDMHAKVREEMKTGSSVRILEWPEDFETLRRIFFCCEAMFAMRLHALVLALNFKKPCVGLSYDAKSDELCGRFKIPEIGGLKDGNKARTEENSIFNLLNGYASALIQPNPWTVCVLTGKRAA